MPLVLLCVDITDLQYSSQAKQTAPLACTSQDFIHLCYTCYPECVEWVAGSHTGEQGSLEEQCMELVACKQYSGLRSSLVAASCTVKLGITVKFGSIKFGGLRSSSVAFKLYSEVWWCQLGSRRQ